MKLQCTAISEYAAARIQETDAFHVFARFDKVIDLTGGGSVISIQTSDVPLTPLALVLEAEPFARLCQALERSGMLAVEGGVFRCGALAIAADTAWRFSGRIAPAERGPEKGALRRVQSVAALMAKPDSLVFAAAPGLAEVAGVNLTELHRRAAEQLEAGRPWELVGLGSGLTPGGDDLLIGVLAALTWLDQTERFAALAGQVERRLEQTGSISRAFLERAMAGEFSQPVLELFEALGEENGQRLVQAVGRLCSIGHTSGSDLLGGVLWTLKEYFKWEGMA